MQTRKDTLPARQPSGHIAPPAARTRLYAYLGGGEFASNSGGRRAGRYDYGAERRGGGRYDPNGHPRYIHGAAGSRAEQAIRKARHDEAPDHRAHRVSESPLELGIYIRRPPKSDGERSGPREMNDRRGEWKRERASPRRACSVLWRQ